MGLYRKGVILLETLFLIIIAKEKQKCLLENLMMALEESLLPEVFILELISDLKLIFLEREMWNFTNSTITLRESLRSLSVRVASGDVARYGAPDAPLCLPP